jgi:phosphatidylserine/phosphatidylglycerophosphate/cardiolipin synthase-like enzyme
MPNRSDWTIAGPTVYTSTSIKTYNRSAELFPDIYEAIQSADGRGHFIYLIGWDVEIENDDTAKARKYNWPGVSLVAGKSDTSLHAVLGAADSRGVAIRAMFDSDLTFSQRRSRTQRAVDFINSLKNGAAIWDSRVIFAGCHHQKIVVVLGRNGLIGFAGGLDLAPWREGFVDVHCRLMGAAVVGLFNVFGQRWTDHPDVESLPATKQVLPLLSSRDARPGPDSNNQVQVGRTFGNPRNYGGLDWLVRYLTSSPIGATKPDTYAFAPNGETTAAALIENAITRARRFIYAEDQYLFASEMGHQPDIRQILAKQLASVPALRFIALINRSEQLVEEVKLPWTYRKKFIDAIKSGNPGKVDVIQYKQAEAPNPLHSKCWIVDDTFAVLGSANCNRRGYSHDSEVAVGITGASRDGTEFAKALRIKTWLNHLNPWQGPPKFTAGDVDQWDKGVALMLARGSRLEPYYENAQQDPPFKVPQRLVAFGDGTSPGGRKKYWDSIVDPDGS